MNAQFEATNDGGDETPPPFLLGAAPTTATASHDDAAAGAPNPERAAPSGAPGPAGAPMPAPMPVLYRPHPYPPLPPKPPVSNLAVVSFVCGLCSTFLILLFGIGGVAAGTAAIITGHRALSRLHPLDSTGKAFAAIGLGAGYFGAVVGLVVLLFLIAYAALVIGFFATLFAALTAT